MQGFLGRILEGIDDRTGIRSVLHEALYERIPGGARYRYVWGSTLVFAFSVQVITGFFLWMCYSPSGHTAWESVYYVQHQMQGGWLLRGIHHFMAHAMVVLLALHMVQVVIDGAYRAPREVNFWLGLILLQIVLALSLTGYLLPWDQKGYWATRVATNLMGIVPGVGPQLQKLVVGGSDYGHHTLTRFFALHAGLLPALLVGFLILHVAIFRRHGIHVPEPRRSSDATFWPDQVLKDSVACLAVLVVVLFFIVRPSLPTFLGGSGLPFGAEHLGAELGAPADAAHEYSAARPEWYFLFLFQFLKLFEGRGELGELMGAIVIPGLVMLALFLMPIVGRWKLGHRFNIGLLFALLLGVAFLTGQALWDDYCSSARIPGRSSVAANTIKELERKQKTSGPDSLSTREKKLLASNEYLIAVSAAETEANRTLELVHQGIPPEGVLSLLRKDPKSQGPRLFARYCAGCHAHALSPTQPDVPAAPDLTNFASREWIAGILDPKKIIGQKYFGRTAHKDGEMADFVQNTLEAKPEDLRSVAAALSAEARLPDQMAQDDKDADLIAQGRELIKGSIGCTDCHQFADAGGPGLAPRLIGYGSREWISGMIANPTHEHYYADKNDRMPSFAPDSSKPENNQLSAQEISLLVDWLRGDWYGTGDRGSRSGFPASPVNVPSW